VRQHRDQGRTGRNERHDANGCTDAVRAYRREESGGGILHAADETASSGGAMDLTRQFRRITVITIVLLAGCSTAAQSTWTKPSGTEEELAKDRYDCLRQSGVPYGASVFSAGGASAFGSSQASGTIASPEAQFIPLGVARRAQNQANVLFDNCMRARGWR